MRRLWHRLLGHTQQAHDRWFGYDIECSCGHEWERWL